jgi:HTH-type transcriptional regulator/antitoxin HigA
MTHAVTVSPIHNARDFRVAMSRLDELAERDDVEPGTQDGDELEVLSVLIEAYEQDHFPMGDPNPIEAIRFRLDQLDMDRSELAQILGGRSRVSEIFSGRRQLTMSMIIRLRQALGIPADALIPRPKRSRSVKTVVRR